MREKNPYLLKRSDAFFEKNLVTPVELDLNSDTKDSSEFTFHNISKFKLFP